MKSINEDTGHWTPNSGRLGNVSEVSRYLGCSVGHLYNLVSQNEIVAIRGPGLKFDPVDVENFIEERKTRKD